MTILKAVESGLAVATFDKTGRAMTANPGYLEFCGGSLAKLKDLDRPAAWRSGALTGDALWSKLEEGETLTAEYEAARGGGQTASIVATLVPSFGMFGKFSGVVEFAADTADGAVAELAGKVNAIDRSQAVIEFELDGTIIKANDNFLGAMGYTLEEIVGKHHRIFVDPKESAQAEYKEFWATLKRGEFQSAEYRRVNKKGEDIWIQATYNPVFDRSGAPVKVIKFATDITARKIEGAQVRGKIEAIDRAQAVIEFELDGTIIKANDNFLGAMGYAASEIEGKHHRIFVDPVESAHSDYEEFWASLRRGEFKSAEYRRLNKKGEDVWIQATYNPIFGPTGEPVKVVKLATDITARKLREAEATSKIDAVDRAQAVIEFELDGTIIKANENFLGAVGYSLDEIAGKHHRIFVDPAESAKQDYEDFWATLRRGEFQSAEYRRLNKKGEDIWIQATYNPILGPTGDPVKIVKFATDITASYIARKEAEERRKVEMNKAQHAVSTLSDGLSRMAHGDLSQPVPEDFAEEYMDLAISFNQAQHRLASSIQGVAAKATSMGSGSTEVHAAADDLARRTEGQAAALEETVAALNQLTEGLKNAAKEAEQAERFSASTADEVKQNEDVVRKSLKAMSEIEESSRKIVNVVSVIDDIAFQTNLLALNAGVEAARAGESGRGFAVVASEVRLLSERCAASAQEIKSLIMESNGQITKGVGLVNKTGEALVGIVSSVDETSRIVSSISAESKNQSAGVGEIMDAMRTLDDVTQHNAAMVEEMTAASTNLSNDSQELTQMMGKFSVQPQAGEEPLRDVA